ncbi:uncharacterized protein LOC106669761 [Cimex lectularius]|uniref:Uncharacterized protein n=1 Tax=Cimex lectularius TaxID=79782 RepID=A0A8I6RYN3_CIMLE|nr:uncharacterized protein LOC106669761 [Cimex lectularius]
MWTSAKNRTLDDALKTDSQAFTKVTSFPSTRRKPIIFKYAQNGKSAKPSNTPLQTSQIHTVGDGFKTTNIISPSHYSTTKLPKLESSIGISFEMTGLIVGLSIDDKREQLYITINESNYSSAERFLNITVKPGSIAITSARIPVSIIAADEDVNNSTLTIDFMFGNEQKRAIITIKKISPSPRPLGISNVNIRRATVSIMTVSNLVLLKVVDKEKNSTPSTKFEYADGFKSSSRPMPGMSALPVTNGRHVIPDWARQIMDNLDLLTHLLGKVPSSTSYYTTPVQNDSITSPVTAMESVGSELYTDAPTLFNKTSQELNTSTVTLSYGFPSSDRYSTYYTTPVQNDSIMSSITAMESVGSEFYTDESTLFDTTSQELNTSNVPTKYGLPSSNTPFQNDNITSPNVTILYNTSHDLSSYKGSTSYGLSSSNPTVAIFVNTSSENKKAEENRKTTVTFDHHKITTDFFQNISYPSTNEPKTTTVVNELITSTIPPSNSFNNSQKRTEKIHVILQKVVFPFKRKMNDTHSALALKKSLSVVPDSRSHIFTSEFGINENILGEIDSKLCPMLIVLKDRFKVVLLPCYYYADALCL